MCDDTYANVVRKTTNQRFYSKDDSHKDDYVNVDKPQTCSTRRDQNKENSGCVSAGCYRWTTVGLLLLCVLLVAVIVVLTVKNDQLQTSYKNLTIENGQLQTSYEDLTIENVHLQTSYENLTLKNNQLHTSYENLTLKNNQLHTSYENLTLKNNQLQTSYENLTLKNNQLQTSYKDLTIKHNQLQMENNQSLAPYLDQGWLYYQSSVYIITTEKKSWSASRQDCKQRGADLVVINSEAEQMFIRRSFPKTAAWIGLNDIDKEGTFMWVDGTALNTGFWIKGEPNNADNKENCVETSYTDSPLRSWNDYFCDRACNGICEKRL